MTIGQRIAEKRREQGLSQEALGESLGVTRQSISKWEGDVTLPEIEKLIALSRLFGVSVGWLLGEEFPEAEEDASPASEEPERAPSPEELSEEQLRMVEEIVGRYIAAQPSPLPPRQRRVLKLAAALAVLCLAAGFFRLSGQIRDVRAENEYLRQAIGSVSSSVSSQISGITRRVEEVLKAQNNLLVGYSVEKKSINYRGNTVTFQASALPKFYEEGMSVAFLVNNGQEAVRAAGAYTLSGVFEAPVTCGLTDEIHVYAVLRRPDGTEERQLLAQFCGLYSETVPEFAIQSDGCDLGSAALSDGVLTVPEQTVAVIPGSAAGPAARVKALQVGLFKNQHLVEWCEPVETPEGYQAGGLESYTFFRMRERAVVFGSGDEICYALVVTDEYGRVTVRYGDLYTAESFRDRDGGGEPSAVRESVAVGWYQYGTMEEWGLTREFLERSPGVRP